MSIKFEISKHAYAFPTKVLAGNGGEHILNIELTGDTDNGVVMEVGAYKSFDNYMAGGDPATYEGKIVDKAADGNFYVEVVEPADAVLIYEVPVIAEQNYDSRFKAVKNFYNEAGAVVRGYVLHKHDVYELSEEGFSGTPEVGKSVTITGKKHVVGA